jgi:DNA-binding transcriptional regulator LsrR (DeoR family)
MPRVAASKAAVKVVTSVVNDVIGKYLDIPGKSRGKLVDVLRIDDATLSRWKTGQRTPTVSQMLQLYIETEDERLTKLLRISTEDALVVEKEHEEVRWLEMIPPHFNEEQRAELMEGFDVFDAFFVKSKSTDEVRRSHSEKSFLDLTYFYEVYKSCLRAEALRLTHVPRDTQLEKQLLEAFKNEKLRVALVARVPKKCDGSLIRAEFVAWLFANEVIPKMQRQKGIGLGYGYTMLRIAEIAAPSTRTFEGVDFIPLTALNYPFSSQGYANPESSRIPSSNYVARRFQNKYPSATGWYRKFYRDEEDMRANSEAHYHEFREQVKNLSGIVTSVNGIGRRSFAETEQEAPAATQWRTSDYLPLGNLGEVYNKLKDKGYDVAGEIMGVFFDVNGRQLSPTRQALPGMSPDEKLQLQVEDEQKSKIDIGLDSSFFQLDLEKLRQTNSRGNSWIVASRNYKSKPTYYAIKHGYANSIVIDTEIAEQLLELKRLDG